MKVKNLSIIVTLMIILYPSIAFPQSAKDAVKALKKLEARTQAGISYKDYAFALKEAKIEVNLFLESPQAKENPRLSKAISKTMQHYLIANRVWACKFYGRKVDYYLTPDYASELIKLLLKDYPDTRAFYAKSLNGWLPIDETVGIVWKAASEELNKATKLLTQSSEIIPKDKESARSLNELKNMKKDYNLKSSTEKDYPFVERKSE